MKTRVLCKMSSLSFMITNKCNLNCSFCSRNAKNTNEIFMDPSFIREQISEAMKWAPLQTINLSGGEPFMHPEIEKILEIITSFNLDVRINTNGLLLNDKIIDLINKYNVKMFTISLDSSNPEVHDRIRGQKGAFDITIRNIKKLVENGCKVFVKATVTEENVDTIFDLMKLVETLGIYGFSYSRTIPIGRAKDKKDNNDEFIKKYIEMGKKTSEYALTSKLEFLIDDPLRHKFDKRIEKYFESNPDLSKVWGGCTAGCNFLYVLLNKDVLACTAITEPCGNLTKNTLEEIWNNSKQIEELRTRENLKGKCGKCSKKYICGGCRAYAYATTGDILGEDSFCK